MNILMRSLIVLSVIIMMVCASCAFAQTEGDYKSPPLPKGDNLWSGHRYYDGMTKDELYKIYPPQSQQNYFKQGNEEWIVFDDILTENDLQDIIAFYLKDGKVVGWDKKALPKTPEERLQMIIARHGHGIGESSGDNMDDLAAQKRSGRASEMESQRASEIPVLPVYPGND